MIRKDGFNFGFDESACASCGGKCCIGESGYIFANMSEIERVADYLGMSVEDFAFRYLRKVGYRYSFIEKPMRDASDGIACVFFNFDSKMCDIYAVRPKQCISFPFWESYNTANLTEDGKTELEICKGIKWIK